jgi:hypothetical protein
MLFSSKKALLLNFNYVLDRSNMLNVNSFVSATNTYVNTFLKSPFCEFPGNGKTNRTELSNLNLADLVQRQREQVDRVVDQRRVRVQVAVLRSMLWSRFL